MRGKRTFGQFAGKWWFLYLLVFAKLFRDVDTFTGNGLLDLIVLGLILTGVLYFGYVLTGGEKKEK